MTTHRIIGLPGTGKTTTLLKEIDNLIQQDINVGDISFTTFSKKMASKNVTAIMKRYELEYKDLNNVGTIHGLCRRLLNVDIEERLLKPKDIKLFAKAFGIETKGHTPYINDPADLLTVDSGMFLLSVDAWLRNTLKSFDDIDDYPGYDKLMDEFDIDIVPDFMDAYFHFKRDNGKIDFTDLLEFVCEDGYCMGTTAFFTDEAQDLNPLLNKTCNVLKEDAEYVFIAGDPFQSIYSFMGSDPCFLMNAKVDKKEVLPVTHRYGQSVIDFSTHILQAGGHNNIPELTPKRQSNVISMDVDEYLEFGIPHITENTFHLVRCQYHAYPVAKRLIECGTPFIGLFGWAEADISIFNGLVEYCNEGRIQSRYLRELIRIHPSNFFSMDKTKLIKKIANGKKHSYSTADIMNLSSPLSTFTGSNFIASLKDPLKYADVPDIKFDRITNCLKYFNTELNKKSITTRLMTIHGSKGMQADNVFVWDGTNRTITNTIDEPLGLLDESRVWYVAATRCRDNLYWVNSNERHAWEVCA